MPLCKPCLWRSVEKPNMGQSQDKCLLRVAVISSGWIFLTIHGAIDKRQCTGWLCLCFCKYSESFSFVKSDRMGSPYNHGTKWRSTLKRFFWQGSGAITETRLSNPKWLKHVPNTVCWHGVWEYSWRFVIFMFQPRACSRWLVSQCWCLGSLCCSTGLWSWQQCSSPKLRWPSVSALTHSPAISSPPTGPWPPTLTERNESKCNLSAQREEEAEACTRTWHFLLDRPI